MALSAAFLAPAPFGLKLLIGLAAVDDGPEVRYLPIVGDLAFGSAHGVPPLWLLLRRPLSVANIAWSALDALPPETKIFTFRDIEGQRSLRDQPHGTLTMLPTATYICPTPRDYLLASMNECGVKRGFHESQYRDRLHSG